MTQVCCFPHDAVDDHSIQFVVAAARYQDQWLFCRHKERTTWEMPGGRREPGESVSEAMERELWEETGSLNADVKPAFAYSVTKDGVTTYGMLFYAQIHTLGPLPEAFEIGETCLRNNLPELLTWQAIQPELFSWIQGWLNMQSSQQELWDVYDENRNLTGKLHPRGKMLPHGCYHLVVHVWIMNDDGKFLITKRSPNKGFPNMWECTGGSALAGDDSLTAALREVQEETGLMLEPENGKVILSTREKDYFRDVWLFRQSFELSRVVLQPGETVDKHMAGEKEIRKLFSQGAFVPYDYLEELFSQV